MNDDTSGGYVNARVAGLYDLNPRPDARQDAAFYVEAAREAGGPVLELGCGTGRVLIEIARAGVEVIGLDLAQPMLDIQRDKLAAEPDDVRERVRLVHGDMCSFDLDREFALVIIPFRPFQHLIDVDDQLACLRCINRHLPVGGRFILDLFQTNPRRIHGQENTEEREDFDVELADGRHVRRTHRLAGFHLVEQYNDVELIHYVTDAAGTTERIVQAFPFRYFFRYEVEHLLARCGFGIKETYGNFDRSPLTNRSPEMIFVAETKAVGCRLQASGTNGNGPPPFRNPQSEIRDPQSV